MKKIKLFEPFTGKKEEEVIKKILNSHFWASGSGNGLVKKFEENFKNYVNSKECVAVSNGTAALHLALSMLDIRNKEVILPSMTFVATAHAIVLNGGKPVFADVNESSLCIDPKEIESKITKNTKAILPVHFGGFSADLKKISKIAKDFNISIVEDAAHAAGSKYNGQKIGSHGEFVCFSFHPVKNLAMPTGGIISINKKQSKEIVKKLHAKRWCGITERIETDYNIKEIGWNYYMNEFSAGIGLEQLKKLDTMNNIRKKIAKKYDKKLNIERKIPFNEECSFHIYWICIKNRKKFRKKLDENGIETGTHYKPVHHMDMYKIKSKLKITDNVSTELVSIPIHPNLTEENVEKIIQTINENV
ncbi:UDP-4-amino-4-deoxy-L-arabinose--oxoglutarate aminotransferase protein [Marine Group I thaumarchaeote SCGC AAA799-P11]|uniref:UDP-4-amino-4-deoxy-L-arabinose--oxoglutarate aminotransferase protein n=1 Tax=Marine Group I thaumarchaeote SCGC AAA799-P11 TaxID=1502295 RepID=A0A087S2Z4_9ARCH|nr:UDP-4-amino-4-deoxy-L-arabinose--oxoglutarate aminotransferase protein [Marine Group I thaumarchaeote SCGC AAA799-P11]